VFESWDSGNFIRGRHAKGHFLMVRLRYKDKPKERWEEWRFAYFLSEWLCCRQYARRGDPSVEQLVEDPNPKPTYNEFRSQVGQAAKLCPPLRRSMMLQAFSN
jgi:hypothetical protein